MLYTLQFNKAPFIRITIPLIFGILLAIYFPRIIPALNYITISLVVALSLVTFIRKLYFPYHLRWVYGIALNIVLIFTGYQLTINKTEIYSSTHFSKLVDTYNNTLEYYGNKNAPFFIVQLNEPLVEKNKTFKAVVGVKYCKKDSNWIKTTGNALIYIQKTDEAKCLNQGDEILLNSRLIDVSPPQNPEEFDYKRYLAFNQIYQQAFIKSDQWKLINKRSYTGILSYINSLRAELLAVLKSNMPDKDQYAVASALLLGYSEAMDDNLFNSYAGTGALHILAVSGSHVAIIFAIINYLLIFHDRIKYGRLIKTIIVLLAIWLYAALTGLCPSVMRAAIMFSVVVIGLSLNRYRNIYNSLAFSAFVLLLYNPYLIMNVGFQLSYLAVAGIVFIQPKIYQLWQTDNWLLNQIWMLIAVSLAAQIAVFPLSLYYFHQFPVYFIITNLAAIPLAFIIMCIGISLLFVFKIPFLFNLLVKALCLMIFLMNKTIELINNLPFSTIKGISINYIETYLIYGLILSIIAFLIVKHSRYLKLLLALIIILLVFQLTESYKQYNQSQIVVYNIPKETAIDFINKRSNCLITTVHENKNFKYHIQPNWWKNNLDNNIIRNFNDSVMVNEPNLYCKNNYIQFHNKRIAIINHEQPNAIYGKKLKLDYIIISGNSDISIGELKKACDFNKIIIDSSNKSSKIKKWIQQCRLLNLNYYAVSVSGAYVETI